MIPTLRKFRGGARLQTFSGEAQLKKNTLYHHYDNYDHYQEYCLAKPPPANKVRFGRLLLVLPAINKFRYIFSLLDFF